MHRKVTTLALGALLTLGLAGASQARESGHAARHHVVHRGQTVAPQGYYNDAPGYGSQGPYDPYDYEPSGADISGSIGGIGH